MKSKAYYDPLTEANLLLEILFNVGPYYSMSISYYSMIKVILYCTYCTSILVCAFSIKHYAANLSTEDSLYK